MGPKVVQVTDEMLVETQTENPKEFLRDPFGRDGARGVPIALPMAEREQWQAAFNQLPVMVHLGAFVDIRDPVTVRVVLPKFYPYHLGGMGGTSMNGGMIAAMFDCALAVAGILQFPEQAAGTVDLSIKISRAVCSQRVVAYSRAIKRTETIAFVEAVLFDGQNRHCASAAGIVAAT